MQEELLQGPDAFKVSPCDLEDHFSNTMVSPHSVNAFRTTLQVLFCLPPPPQAIELQPEHPAFYYHRGVVSLRMHRDELAIQDFNKALDLGCAPHRHSAVQQNLDTRMGGCSGMA